MMSATQPFLSGAISKTVNLPNDCSVQDIADAYTESWRLGLKAVAIYRDGSKGTQPLNVSAQTSDEKKGTKVLTAAEQNATKKSEETGAPSVTASSSRVGEGDSVTATALAAAQAKLELLEAQIAALQQAATATPAQQPLENADYQEAQAPPRAMRHRLPAERASITHKFGIAGHEGYITVGLYPNGAPGEIFIRMAKEGSTISGLMDSFATAVSMCLQHGVPLKLLCEKFAHTRFEPSGWTGNEQIGYAKSIMDYLFRWMQLRFLSGHQLDLFANMRPAASLSQSVPVAGSITGADSSVTATTPYLSSRSEAEGPAVSSHEPTSYAGSTAEQLNDRRAPQQGIASEPQAMISRDIIASNGIPTTGTLNVADNGLYHASDAMKGMYDMGDAPSCSTCGAIMVRNGACHRCMECGSTSGCS